jgi:hypothetical protein
MKRAVELDTTKTAASAATIAVEPHVIARIHRLKTLTVAVHAGPRCPASQGGQKRSAG